MLQVDPKKRISGAEALQHPWIKKYLSMKAGDVEDIKLNQDIIT